MNSLVVVPLFEGIITGCNKVQMFWLQGNVECSHVVESVIASWIPFFKSLEAQLLLAAICTTSIFFHKALNSITAKINFLPLFCD